MGKLDYNTYLKERKSLIDAEREGARSFDKFILTLSAGSFGLSLTFINKIASDITRWTIWLLAVTWSFFLLSILSTLVSFLMSQLSCRRQRDIIDKACTEGTDPCNETNKPSQWTDWLNVASIAFFVLGALFLIIFSITNVYEGGCNMAKDSNNLEKGGFRAQKSPQTTKITEGFSAQKTPVGKDNGFVAQKTPVNKVDTTGTAPSKETSFAAQKPSIPPAQSKKE